MRVVAGSAGGLRLLPPTGRDVRPTSDRVREALFGALGSLGAVEGSEVLDMFAGSGALGIEALSRGAARATFVDRAGSALDVVRANLDHTGLADRASVVRADALALLGGDGPAPAPAATGLATVDLVLCDPPYDFDAWPVLLAAVEATVAPAAVVVVESDHEVDLPAAWVAERSKRYGRTWTVIGRTPA